MINEYVTVVTVTFNNRIGLIKTLDSLCKCKTLPKEIIIVDGGSKDGTAEAVNKYRNQLTLRFISEPDDGIYNAMNKGLRNVRTPLVHYLNSGDIAAGDLYFSCNMPILLPVKIINPENGMYWFDKVKMSGYGYCHQGIIFPSNHLPFNESLMIAADFEAICRTFMNGLNALPFCDHGYVIYELGGVSTVKSDIGNSEIIAIAKSLLSKGDYLKIISFIALKSIVPRLLRRHIVNLFRTNSGN